MNTIRSIAESPELLLLAKWTVVLALAWGLHAGLRNRHPRWRITLWRAMWVFGLALLLGQLVEIPGIRVPLPAATSPMIAPATASLPASSVDAGPTATAPRSTGDTVVTPLSEAASAIDLPPPGWVLAHPLVDRIARASRREWVLGTWVLGVAIGLFGLLRQSRQLRAILARAEPARPELQRRAGDLLTAWRPGATVEVRISRDVRSPFVCGWRRPVLVLPEHFGADLSAAQTLALLGHELAHVCRDDLLWNLAWRGTAIVCWFHPLVWCVPGAHALACELEADRRSAELQPSREQYARSLAQLALLTLRDVRATPALALNGVSHIARRLSELERAPSPGWRPTRVAGALTLLTSIVAIVAGCRFGEGPDSKASDAYAYAEVQVLDAENDQPIEGAEVQPFGFRVQGNDSASAYGWHGPRFGPRTSVTTDATGKARIRYPVVAIPEEKQRTGQLLLSVKHDRYAHGESQQHPVEGPAPAIRLHRGVTMRVSGFHGTDRKPVTELTPCLVSDKVRMDDWQPEGNGVFVFHRFSPGQQLLQFMGRLPSGEVVYSDSLVFEAERGKDHRFELEMKPGIRVEGRLDDRVPRPVRDGRVLIAVRPQEYPPLAIPEDIGDLMKRYGGWFQPWHTHRPIAEDGTFVFESVPPGGLDVVCLGRGFASANGAVAQNRLPSGQVLASPPIGVPQSFALQAPLTRITVLTEATGTLRVTAHARNGTPVAGAKVSVSPNMIRMPGGIFGEAEASSESPFHRPDPLPELPYEATTDANGIAVLANIPACTRILGVEHPQWVPVLDGTMKDRWIRVALAPGQTTDVRVSLVAKGTDFRGTPP